MSNLRTLNSKFFIDGMAFRVSTSPINNTSYLYESILGINFYITKVSSGRYSLEDGMLIEKINAFIFSYFQSATVSNISDLVSYFKPDNINDLKTLLESSVDQNVLLSSQISTSSFNPALIDFNYQIDKITLYDYGKARLKITFNQPEEILKIYFLQVPAGFESENYAKISGLTSMIENNLHGLRCDRFNSYAATSKKEQSFDIEFVDTGDVDLLIGVANTQGYNIAINNIIRDAEYSILFEDLRSSSKGRVKLNKGTTYANVEGETSNNAGHNHKYVIDKNGNGYALFAVNPENSEIRHRHKVVNYVIQPAQSLCFPNCRRIYDADGVPPHVHSLQGGGVAQMNTAAIEMPRININAEQEIQQSLY
tara:strand:- start:591 stop:1691 length:1101 start_codon:yes stop_codon:yes gene_type:complete